MYIVVTSVFDIVSGQVHSKDVVYSSPVEHDDEAATEHIRSKWASASNNKNATFGNLEARFTRCTPTDGFPYVV